MKIHFKPWGDLKPGDEVVSLGWPDDVPTEWPGLPQGVHPVQHVEHTEHGVIITFDTPATPAPGTVLEISTDYPQRTAMVKGWAA